MWFKNFKDVSSNWSEKFINLKFKKNSYNSFCFKIKHTLKLLKIIFQIKGNFNLAALINNKRIFLSANHSENN